MKKSQYRLLSLICFLFFSCSGNTKTPIALVANEKKFDGFSTVVSPEYWTEASSASLEEMQKNMIKINASLPLSTTLISAFQGKNSDLLQIGSLKNPNGIVPGKSEIEDHISEIKTKAEKNYNVDYENGTDKNLLFWILRISTSDIHMLKAIYSGYNNRPPLCIDIYIPSEKYTDSVFEEYKSILFSIRVE
jgi:hypothetical protein